MKTLDLKWGTLKGWVGASDIDMALLEEYGTIGSSASAMAQRDTIRQKEIICALIDNTKGNVWNDWDGEVMTNEAAKKYIMEYRR